jgi:hypothetical protein
MRPGGQDAPMKARLRYWVNEARGWLAAGPRDLGSRDGKNGTTDLKRGEAPWVIVGCAVQQG